LAAVLKLVPDVKETLLSAPQFFLWFFRGLVINQMSRTRATGFKLSTVAECLSKDYRMDVLKLTYLKSTFKAVVKIPLKNTMLELVSDNADSGILTYEPRMYPDIDLSVPKKLITALDVKIPFKKYAKRLLTGATSLETLNELIPVMAKFRDQNVTSESLMAFITGMLVDTCGMMSHYLSQDKTMMTVCPNYPENLIVIVENRTHFAVDEIVKLYKNDPAVREYLSRKTAIVLGIKDTDTITSTVDENFSHKINLKSICFVKQYTRIKRHFPINRLILFSTNSNKSQQVAISLKTPTLDHQCNFAVVVNTSEDAAQMERGSGDPTTHFLQSMIDQYRSVSFSKDLPVLV